MIKTVSLLAAVGTSLANSCPSSPSTPHASCGTTVKAAASCADVAAEMVARVNGEAGWVDPHNGGTYSVLSSSATELQLKRVTGDHKPGPYTDLITFELAGSGATCVITGCSASQSTSVGDFSTNYCNQRNLYCGSAEGCKVVKNDFAISETDVKPSIGAGKDPSQCIVASQWFTDIVLPGHTVVSFVPEFAPNPTHYGDPATGCQADEIAVQVTGVSGDFCSPQCKSTSCPTDVPDGVTAAPQCALQTTSGDKYCALICDPSASGACGSGSCKSIQGTGLCTYDDR